MLTREQAKRIAEPLGLEAHEVCFYCHVAHKQVEAGGIWYCPSPICGGPAGGIHRHVLECPNCVTTEHSNYTEVHSGCSLYQQLWRAWESVVAQTAERAHPMRVEG